MVMNIMQPGSYGVPPPPPHLLQIFVEGSRRSNCHLEIHCESHTTFHAMDVLPKHQVGPSGRTHAHVCIRS